MNIDYSKAKPSLHIEEEVSAFIRKDGKNYIDFIKAYYDWLERKFIIVTLSSENYINWNDIKDTILSPIDTTFILRDELFGIDPSTNNIISIDENFLITESWGINPANTIDFIPIDNDVIITENQDVVPLVLNPISYLPYSNNTIGILAPRILVFAEYVSGIIENNLLISQAGNNAIFITDYIDVKSPLNIINNIENSQEIDYVLDYNNNIYNLVFINAWKELMFGFPLSLYDTFDTSIRDIIVKNIKDFYKTKGSFTSFQYLFKILYNESLTINGTNQGYGYGCSWNQMTDVYVVRGQIANSSIYIEDTYSYVIKSKYGASVTELTKDLKKIVHPVGFNFTITENS
jgi:hypothetical protein